MNDLVYIIADRAFQILGRPEGLKKRRSDYGWRHGRKSSSGASPRTVVPKTKAPRTEMPRTEVPRIEAPRTEVLNNSSIPSTIFEYPPRVTYNCPHCSKAFCHETIHKHVIACARLQLLCEEGGLPKDFFFGT